MRDLSVVHPKLRDGVNKILPAMAAIGFPMMVTDTLRTVEEQQKLYDQGRTTPGPIVTNCDGIKNKSNHQAHADGWGHAVDMCFVIDGKPSWDSRLPWKLYGLMAQTLGLIWGGSWKSLTDLPHIEIGDV